MAHYRKTIAILGLSTASALALALGCSERQESLDGASSEVNRASDLVISQVYGGGGNRGALFKHDFIELFNRGKNPISLKGKVIQVANEVRPFGTEADSKLELPDETLEPGRYFLVKLAGGGPDAAAANLAGEELPSPAFSVASVNLTAKRGKVALVEAANLLDGCGGEETAACDAEKILDLVTYGAAAQAAGGASPELSNTTAAVRGSAGCINTFTASAPTPRTTQTAATDCATQPDGAAPQVDASLPDFKVLLNELRVKAQRTGPDAPNEFIELTCKENASLDGFYVLAIEGDGSSAAGTVDVAVALDGKKCGANGLVYLKAENGGAPAQSDKTTTIGVADFDARDGSVGLENATTSFVVVWSPTAIAKGTNLDPGKTGKLTALPEGAKLVDGVATFDQASGETDLTYAPRIVAKDKDNGGAPVAPWVMSRIKGNSEALTESAWYGAKLFGDDPARAKYDFKVATDNLPQGDVLPTPGGPNDVVPRGPGRDGGTRRDASAVRGDNEDEAEDFGDEMEPAPGQKPGKKPATPPKLGAVNDCAMTSGPTEGSALVAFGTLAIAIAAAKRRRRG